MVFRDIFAFYTSLLSFLLVHYLVTWLAGDLGWKEAELFRVNDAVCLAFLRISLFTAVCSTKTKITHELMSVIGSWSNEWITLESLSRRQYGSESETSSTATAVSSWGHHCHIVLLCNTCKTLQSAFLEVSPSGFIVERACNDEN